MFPFDGVIMKCGDLPILINDFPVSGNHFDLPISKIKLSLGLCHKEHLQGLSTAPTALLHDVTYIITIYMWGAILNISISITFEWIDKNTAPATKTGDLTRHWKLSNIKYNSWWMQEIPFTVLRDVVTYASHRPRFVAVHTNQMTDIGNWFDLPISGNQP